MIGKTLVFVVLLVIVGAVAVLFGFRELRVTDEHFQAIDTSFREQCHAAFGPQVGQPDDLCNCLWEEVRGENRLDMVKRLLALQNSPPAERAAFMTRVSGECAHRLHIQGL